MAHGVHLCIAQYAVATQPERGPKLQPLKITLPNNFKIFGEEARTTYIFLIINFDKYHSTSCMVVVVVVRKGGKVVGSVQQTSSTLRLSGLETIHTHPKTYQI